MNAVLLTCAVISTIDLSGYVEARPYVAWNDSTSFLGYNRGWLEFRSDESKYGAQVALDLIVPYDTLTFGHALDNIDISRLAVWLGSENARVIAGKQSLYWGVGRVFRPLDIFNRTNYFEPGYERAGANALLAYLSIGGLSSLRGILAPRGNIDNTLAGGRFGMNVASNDIGITAMHQSSEELTVIGGEITGELALGYWAEFAYTWQDTLDHSKLSVGVDYTLPIGIYAMIEYFFDGSGVSDPADYDFTQIAYGYRQTLAQHYVYASIGLFQNPFLRPAFNVIANLNDGGLIIIPQITYALFDNAEVTAGINYAFGTDESEFLNIMEYRGAAYLWARVYF